MTQLNFVQQNCSVCMCDSFWMFQGKDIDKGREKSLIVVKWQLLSFLPSQSLFISQDKTTSLTNWYLCRYLRMVLIRAVSFTTNLFNRGLPSVVEVHTILGKLCWDTTHFFTNWTMKYISILFFQPPSQLIIVLLQKS